MALGPYITADRLDELSRRDTPLHRLDPRAKAITTAVLIVVTMSYPRYEIGALLPLFLFPIALIARADLPVRLIGRSLLYAAPFALLVGLFNPWLDRHVMLVIGGWPITGGWLSFGSILARFTLTVTSALVLVATSGIYPLCAGLERLGMPRLFAVQILLVYRYLFAIGEEGQRLSRSAALRSGNRGSLHWQAHASLVGHLLLRSLDRAQRVYQAMLARGFTGELRAVRAGRWGRADTVFVAGWSAFFVAARCWDMTAALGHALTGGGR